MTAARPNRLAGETSPYLLQHAHNPVDWYPWGREALALARAGDRPILLSVGYSSCHWCHVMARECFEDEAIAGLMNQHFICIKVDREERPDIDHLYMEAVQAMTGGGGWPLTVFLTPEGQPFYGGTYFPPEDRHGLPGFPRLLAALSEAYRDRRSQVAAVAQDLVSRLKQEPDAGPEAEALTQSVLDQAFRGVEAAFDEREGGFGPGPKFPQAPLLEFLLLCHRRTGLARPLQMLELTLQRMAAGGIYDQIGGGFHRYATDGRWLVPHFEKMLYDNALLARLYHHSWLVTGRAVYRRVSQETLDYVLREMTLPGGGFCSSQDADVNGEEGRYYLWTPGEIAGLLGAGDGRMVSRYFGVGSAAAIDGRSVLHVPPGAAAEAGSSPADVAASVTADVATDAAEVVARSRARMLEERSRRPAPARDDKVLASWNGLMLQALAEAAGAFGRPDYGEAAAASARFLVRHMMPDGRLAHSRKSPEAPGQLEGSIAPGVPGYLEASRVPGYLEDYAAVARGLVALHEITLDSGWLEKAFALTEAVLARFVSADRPGLWYDTGPDHDPLFARPRNTVDSATPCGGSSAAEMLLRASRLTGDTSQERAAAAMMLMVRDQMLSHPMASGHWLCALDLHLASPEEIVVVGRRDDPGTEALLAAVHGQYLPHRALLGWAPGTPVPPRLRDLTRGRGITDGVPTAYLCRGHQCHPPTSDAGELRRLLSV